MTYRFVTTYKEGGRERESEREQRMLILSIQTFNLDFWKYYRLFKKIVRKIENLRILKTHSKHTNDHTE